MNPFTRLAGEITKSYVESQKSPVLTKNIPIFYDTESDNQSIKQLWLKYGSHPEVPYIYVYKNPNNTYIYRTSYVYGNLGAEHYEVNIKRKLIRMVAIS